MVARLRPDFEAAFMAIRKVEVLLRKVTRALDKARIPYAVVGGNAVAAWVATVDEDAIRATRDVDILVRRESLPRITEALRPIGLVPVEVLGVVMYVEKRNPSPKRGVHLVIANERIRAHYAHPAPDLKARVRSKGGFAVIDLPSLVQMKLLSFRPVDQTHLMDLKSVGLLTRELISSIPDDLVPRLRQIQETPE